MILYYNDVTQLKGLDWNYVELRGDSRIEATVRRICQEAPAIFGKECLELFVAVIRRDLNTYELSAGSYLFVRSSSHKCLTRLKQVTGVIGLGTAGDTQRLNDVITVDDAFVQVAIEQTNAYLSWLSEGIVEGSFVRVLDGVVRDLCGVVTSIEARTATVTIAMRSKILTVICPIKNLMNLDHVDDSRRVFWYGEPVESLASHEPQALIGWYGKAPVAEMPQAPKTEKIPKRQREGSKRATGVIKELLAKGVRNPNTLARAVIKRMMTGEIQKTRNLYVLYCTIKDLVRKHLKAKDWWTVLDQHPGWKFSAESIAEQSPRCGIPTLRTPGACKDGRATRHRKT